MAISLNGKPQSRGRYRPLSEINVTPLVDVMLVLLIIFMVTAPLMTSGVSVDLPKSKQAVNHRKAIVGQHRRERKDLPAGPGSAA